MKIISCILMILLSSSLHGCKTSTPGCSDSKVKEILIENYSKDCKEDLDRYEGYLKNASKDSPTYENLKKMVGNVDDPKRYIVSLSDITTIKDDPSSTSKECRAKVHCNNDEEILKYEPRYDDNGNLSISSTKSRF